MNADIIAENSPRNQHTTNDVDNANYYFMSEDYPGANVGLPSSGTFISATTSNMPFALVPYDANNSLRITNTGSGTLEFATPSAAERIYILVTSGSGTTSFTGTINFDDNTTQSISSQSVSDWFGGTTNVAISGIGRINNNNSADNNTNDPRLYQIPIDIDAANQSKNIVSITIEKTVNSGVLNVMAVTAVDGGVPVDYCLPSSSFALYYLSSVEIESDIDNLSDSWSNTPNNPTLGYDNQSSQVLQTFNGDLIEVQTNFYSGANGIRIWVDWDQNGVFDPSNRRGI